MYHTKIKDIDILSICNNLRPLDRSWCRIVNRKKENILNTCLNNRNNKKVLITPFI